MSTAHERLKALKERIYARNDPDEADEFRERLSFRELEGLFHVEFYGTPFDEAYDDLLQTMIDPEIASRLGSISLRGPDEGSNGTRDWDLTPILQPDIEFPTLRTFYLEPTVLEHHNHSIIASGYEENGQIGRLLARSPVLASLTVPSAPDAGFFQVGTRPLVFLRVDTGYDHQDFIANLSRSSCFPQLSRLDFGDYNLRFMEEYPQQCTSFVDYAVLFQSAAIQSVTHFTLRNSILSLEQLRELRHLRRDMTMEVVQEYREYIRNETTEG